MNIQIKFRVFDKISKEMHRWSQIASISLVDFEREYYELMQYTGMKDKNGKEIYEGDILKDSEMAQEVRFMELIDDEYSFVGWVTGAEGIYAPFTSKDCKYLEIIGNIYQTPELL